MSPTILGGSTVQVRFSFNPSARRNSIVYIRSGTRRIVHRLVAVLGPVFVERGDARRFYRLHLRSSIIGVVVGIVPPRDNGTPPQAIAPGRA